MHNYVLRDYQDGDFNSCMHLVNKVWEFDQHFHPPSLSDLFKRIYTGGSLGASNFNKVIEEHSLVKGFLFGKIENVEVPKNEFNRLSGQLKLFKDLLWIKGGSLGKKLSYIHMINTHEGNRRRAEPKKNSEVNLFVVDPASQGKGYGRLLMQSFINECKKQGVLRIILETDSKSNFQFYDHLGFKVKTEFYSPMLKEFSRDTGNTFIYELYL